MPLINMGLVRQPRADAGRHDAEADDRELRCAAGFYDLPRHAEQVADALRSTLGLRAGQLAVIHPGPQAQAELARLARHWQQQRCGTRAGHEWRRTAVGTTVGMLTGALAGAIGWALLQSPSAETSAAMVSGMWAGALAGGLAAAATSVLMGGRPRRHRFDTAVAHELARGSSVVLAQGLPEAHAAPVLARLQASSDSWCADAPRRLPGR